MVESAKPHHPLTVEEYLELEESATVKHEYVAGEIHTLARASDRHNRIAGNILGNLWSAARGGPCRIYMNDMKLRVADDTVYYPDVMVACEPLETYNPSVERAPCLVVEVTSPSTESIDRREKLAAYKRMPGLRAYLIVARDRMWVERHFRDEDGVWRRADLVDEGGRFPVPCPPETGLSLAGIYEGL